LRRGNTSGTAGDRRAEGAAAGKMKETFFIIVILLL
jgi:hypothetical protein